MRWVGRRRRGRASKDGKSQAPTELYPGLAVVGDVIERTVDAQERRVASLDQRGGVLLGFAGLLVGIILRDPAGLDWWSVAAAACAALAALAAGVSIFPLLTNSLDPTELLELYAGEPAEAAQFRILSTVTRLYEEDLPRARRKAVALRVATGLLFAAVLLVGAGATIKSGLLTN